MRFIPPSVHGVLDYGLGALFLAAPSWLGFTDRIAEYGSLGVGGSLLLVSLLTRYPLGVVRVIPFPVHGGIEMVVAPVLVAFPWIGHFADIAAARNFFVITGIVLFGLWLTTDYKSAEFGKPSLFGRNIHTGV